MGYGKALGENVNYFDDFSAEFVMELARVMLGVI